MGEKAWNLNLVINREKIRKNFDRGRKSGEGSEKRESAGGNKVEGAKCDVVTEAALHKKATKITTQAGPLKRGCEPSCAWLDCRIFGDDERLLLPTCLVTYVTPRHLRPLLSPPFVRLTGSFSVRTGTRRGTLRVFYWNSVRLTVSLPRGSVTVSAGGLWPPEPGAVRLIRRCLTGARCSTTCSGDARPAASTSHLLLARRLMSCGAVIWQWPAVIQVASNK